MQKPQVVEEDTADALFLPPCVLKARKRDVDHWAHARNGWRPPVTAPQVEQQSLDGAFGEELMVEAFEERGVLTDEMAGTHRSADGGAEQGEVEVGGLTLPLGEEDEALEYELLSPEESAAKMEIWDEINREILPMLQGISQRKKKRQQEDLKQRKEEEQRNKERWELDLQLHELKKARVERRSRKNQEKEDVERTKEPRGDLDDLFEAAEEQIAEAAELNFWKAHSMSQTQVSYSSSSQGRQGDEPFGAFDEAEQQSAKRTFGNRISQLFGHEDSRRKIKPHYLKRSRCMDSQLKMNLSHVKADA